MHTQNIYLEFLEDILDKLTDNDQNCSSITKCYSIMKLINNSQLTFSYSYNTLFVSVFNEQEFKWYDKFNNIYDFLKSNFTEEDIYLCIIKDI